MCVLMLPRLNSATRLYERAAEELHVHPHPRTRSARYKSDSAYYTIACRTIAFTSDTLSRRYSADRTVADRTIAHRTIAHRSIVFTTDTISRCF